MFSDSETNLCFPNVTMTSLCLIRQSALLHAQALSHNLGNYLQIPMDLKKDLHHCPEFLNARKLLTIYGFVFLWIDRFSVEHTVEPRYNDPRYNDIPGITINMLCPGKSYSKMYGTEPRYNDHRYNDIPDITMSF